MEEPKVEEAPKEEPKPEEAPAAEAPEAEEPAPEPAPEYADVPNVLIAAAECAPFVKVGGLADVVGALPKYLKRIGIDARVIMPLHRQIKEKYFDQMQHLCDFQASLGWRSQYVGLERLEFDGCIFYFIDNEFYFGGPIYCGGEFEGEQYAFFTRAVMDAIPQLDFTPQILHCNDWHTAMMPLLVKTQYQGGMQSGLKTVLSIHNLKFQGQFSHEFDRDLLRVDDSLATPQFIEHYGCDNMLKAGIVFADKVNTVSPTYSQEICGPEMGESLDGVLRSRGGDLWGILNGLDNEAWDPRTDENLSVHFSENDLEGKAQVKAALLEELGLAPAPEGEEVPVIGMVGRLTPQKGIDLVQCVLDDIMRENVRVIVLGSGDAEYENFLRDAENRYKGRLCSYIGYNGPLSHRIYAGSDLFLMPSLFEPCGLSQIIAMRYGTLPIVRETGGLKDTVQPWNQYTGEGNGFSFAHYNAHEMLDCIRYALGTWWDKPSRETLIQNALATDYGFDRCARTYAELYRTL
ncbi:MAG: glycogen synthase GlgA [Coriobacteriia bacterium]|nr:glycogen synthase GlgA [Coriobacteriia bacterium]